MNCFDKFVYFSKIYMHEWIPVNGTHIWWYRDMRYPQVFHALMGCQWDPRVLGHHIISVSNSSFSCSEKANCFDKFVYFSKIYMHEWIPVNGMHMVVSRYAIPTGIPSVDGLSTGPSFWGVT